MKLSLYNRSVTWVTPFVLQDCVAIIWMVNQDIWKLLGEEGSPESQAVVRFAVQSDLGYRTQMWTCGLREI